MAISITGYYDDQGPDTGFRLPGTTTDDTSPELRGMLTGYQPGDNVFVLRDGIIVGFAVLTTGPAGGIATWAYQDSGLTDGNHVYTVMVFNVMTLQSDTSGPCTITVNGAVPPQTLAVTLEAWDDQGPVTGQIPNGGTTDDDTPTLRGALSAELAAGQALHVFRGGVDLGEATVKGTQWQYADSGLTNGNTYDYTAKVVEAGKVVAESDSLSFKFISGPVVPQAITIEVWDDALPVIGQVLNGGVTNDSTPTLKGTLTEPLGAGQSVHLYRDGMDLGQMDVNGTNWEYEDAGLVAYAQYTYIAKVVDQAGGVVAASAETSFTFNPDVVTSVIITGVMDDYGPHTGAILSNGYTDDTTPQLSGTLASPLAPGYDVTILRSDNGSTPVSIGTADAVGTNWNFQDSGLLDNHTYTYTARILDDQGKEQISDPWVIKIWLTPAGVPTIDSYDDDIGNVTGNFYGNTTTDDTMPLLHGTVTGAAAGDVVTIYQDGTAIGTVTVTPAAGSQDWTFQVTTPLDDGKHNFTAEVVNRVGESNVTDDFAITVFTAPMATVTIDEIMDDVGPGIGNISRDGTTNDSTPELKGTLSRDPLPGDDILIYRNGVLIGNAGTLTGREWSFVDTVGGKTDDTTYVYTARVRDAAGNLSSELDPDANYSITLDLGGQVKVGVIAGNDVLDDTEAAGSVTLSGTIDALPDGASGVQVKVTAGGTEQVAVVTGTTWSVTVAGSALKAAAVAGGGHAAVTAKLDFVDSEGVVSNTLTQARDYSLHTEPGYAHFYSVGSANAGVGYSMSVIGDFNGDGYADYIVSAPGNHSPGHGKAGVYILYGGANGLPVVGSGLTLGNLDYLTAAQGIKITNSNTGGQMLGKINVPGGTVTDIGDFNGDGLSDVAIASPLFDTSSGLGAVYVIYGQTQANSHNIDLSRGINANDGFMVYSTTGFAGYSVTGADLNGDGYSDLVFGDPTAGPKTGGSAYVVYGHTGTQSNISIVPNASISGNSTTLTGAGAAGTGYTVLANNSTNGLGTVVSTVGDVNGDGYSDYVVTTPGGLNSYGYTTPGSAYLIFGGPGGITRGGTVSSTTLDNMAGSGLGIKITASNGSEFLGGRASGATVDGMMANAIYAQYHSVAGLGNIDGSGKAAFAIGSPTAINPYVNGSPTEGAGAVYVLFGDQASWANVTLPTYSNGVWNNLGSLGNGDKGFVVYSSSFADKATGGKGTSSGLGFAVSSAGDVNGDGVDDFLIGAPMADNGKGAVFLVFGKAGGLDWMKNPADPSGNTKFAGVVDLDQLVAAGKTDVFGAPGTAVKYSGANNPDWNLQADPSYTGKGSYLGTDVTGGDFSGTGIHGYAFGAWGQDVWSTQAGMALTFDGVTTLLTQQINNANGAVYYAGDGVDKIATGSGSNVWVHGVGVDDTTGPFTTTVQHDAVSGGAGIDFIGIVGTNFTSVNGGGNPNYTSDTLVFEGSGITLNLKEMGLRVQGFEQFDLNNSTHTAAGDPDGQYTAQTHDNTLALRLSDVLSQMGDAPNAQHMTILGDAASHSTVDLLDSGWVKTGAIQAAVNGALCDVWHNQTMGANTAADLLIQQGVLVV
jgi:hypothetical protein